MVKKSCLETFFSLLETYFVCKEAKRQISKQVLQENRARQIFRKITPSYARAYQKILRALVSCNTRFEIRPLPYYRRFKTLLNIYDEAISATIVNNF